MTMPRPGSLCRAHAHDITLCIQHREYFFGDIYHDAMISTPYGEIAQTQWHAIPTRFPNVTAGEHVTMPNHVHGIIYIHPRESLVPAVGGTRHRGTREGRPYDPVDHVCATTHHGGGKNGNIGQYGGHI
jgi:REP element-mobilizing transposase RayT